MAMTEITDGISGFKTDFAALASSGNHSDTSSEIGTKAYELCKPLFCFVMMGGLEPPTSTF
jgi:hypothetical protein